MRYVVTAGYVTVETSVGAGRAYVDIPRGAPVPGDVPAEQVEMLLRLGHVAPAAEPEPASDPVGAGSDDPEPSNQDIREWARTVGLEVSDRGKIPTAVVEAYRDAHK